MLKFLKRQSTPTNSTNSGAVQPSLFSRLKQGLSRTRHQLTDGIASLFIGKTTVEPALLEELETRLLMADVGAAATQTIIDDLQKRIHRKQDIDGNTLLSALTAECKAILQPCEHPLPDPKTHKPFVVLVIGVNGAGKTTTIGKLAHAFQQNGKSVLLAAGDTFRAAAIEQLQAWGERNHIPVIAQHAGADSASVIFDAVNAAQARNIDVIIADTAGRLHNKSHLMEELKKVKRVIQKLDPSAPHETLLVLDAGIGQNAIHQTREFHEAISVSGLCLTKLDGTAKGGIIFALAKQFGLPIRYIGVGEKIDDLRPFKTDEFVSALFAGDEQEEE